LLAKELKTSTGTVSHHDQLQMAYFGQTNINRLNLHKTIEEEIMMCIRKATGARPARYAAS